MQLDVEESTPASGMTYEFPFASDVELCGRSLKDGAAAYCTVQP